MPPAPDTGPPSGTVRTGGRTERTRRAVLAAAAQEVAEHGLGGFSTARVADRAGVHRTTVHRRWPDHVVLVVESFSELAETEISVPDTGDVREDLRVVLRSVARMLDTPTRRGLVRSLVSEAGRSPEIAGAVRRVMGRRFEIAAEILVRAAQRGQVRTDVDPVTLLTMMAGPLYLRLIVTEDPLDDAFVERTIELALRGLEPR